MCCALSNTLPHPPNFHWVPGMCSCWTTTYICFSWTREQIIGPRAREGAAWVEFPVLLPSNSVESQLWAPCVANGMMNAPKTSEGRASFACFVSTKWAGNWYLSLEQTWVRGRNPKTCFLTTQSRTDCKHFFNYILLCVATLFFLYLVSKYESCNGFILYCHSWKRIVYAAASRRGLFFKSLLICESFDRNVLFYLPELSSGFCPGSFLQLH